MLLKEHIAVSDVIAECDIIGSSDSSIRNVTPMDLNEILENADIRRIYANGGTAAKLFRKYQQKSCGREIINLPSTSPANAAFSLERLLQEWGRIRIAISQDSGFVHRIGSDDTFPGNLYSVF